MNGVAELCGREGRHHLDLVHAAGQVQGRLLARFRNLNGASSERDERIAPFSGPPPWNVYRLTFHTVFGVATDEPHGASRWRFSD